jgi:hypothetical protein
MDPPIIKTSTSEQLGFDGIRNIEFAMSQTSMLKFFMLVSVSLALTRFVSE